MTRAKGEQIASTSAGSNASGIIIRIRVSPGASCFEDLGVGGGLARLGISKATRATIPRRVESETSTLARHHPLVVTRSDLKPHRAHHIQVTDTPSIATLSLTLKRRDGDGQVVAIHQTHVVEVLLRTQCDLRQGCRWCTADAVAEEGPTAVTGGAASAARGVERAAASTPETPGPERWEVEGVRPGRWELETAAGEDRLSGSGLDAWPYWVWASVVYCDRCRRDLN